MSSEFGPRTVGILIFPDVEILDFCGPFEVFSTARLPGRAGTVSYTHLTLPTILRV